MEGQMEQETIKRRDSNAVMRAEPTTGLRARVHPGDYVMTPWHDEGTVSRASAFPWPVTKGNTKGKPLAFIVEGALVCGDGGDSVQWVGQLFEGEPAAGGGAQAGKVLAEVTAHGMNGRAQVKHELEVKAGGYVKAAGHYGKR